MLNFSETVWVFKSSSLPARDGALESSKGEPNGPPVKSELQLVRLDDRAEGDCMGDSSRYDRAVLSFLGGSSISEDSAMVALLYMCEFVGEGKLAVGAVPGRMGCVKERAEFARADSGRADVDGNVSSVSGSCVPELRRRWGGASPLGDCGIMVRRERVG